LQPLTVRKVLLPTEATKHAPIGQKNAVIYELVAGERRLRAAKLAELTHVPCIIINTDDATSAELAIIENLLRENLNMFEQAEAFARLISEFHLTQEEAARRVSMSQSAVANKLRILRLLPEERAKILEAGLTERHARALLKLNDPALRGDVLQQVLEKKMNVSATEAYIDSILTEIARYQAKKQPHAPYSSRDVQETVSEVLPMVQQPS
jgi:ParB family chromosome partitioning protein